MAEKFGTTPEELERRRIKGIALLQSGVRQADVARTLGVKPQSVAVWARRFKDGGMQALKKR